VYVFKLGLDVATAKLWLVANNFLELLSKVDQLLLLHFLEDFYKAQACMDVHNLFQRDKCSSKTS